MGEFHGSAASNIRKFMDLYLRNDRDGAFRLIYPESSDPKTNYMETAVHAMIELTEGMLSGSTESITRSLDLFWSAEKGANESLDRDQLGCRITRGLSYLFGAIVQLFTGSYVKVGVNLAVGYKLIRGFEAEVLSYKSDIDQDLIRSLGLLILALLNFFSVVLPSSVLSVGDLLGIGPSKNKFEEYINMCGNEGGQFAFMAKLIRVYSVINSKNFMFEKISPNDLKLCRTLMDECLVSAPDSIVLRVMDASVMLGEGRRKDAIASLSSLDLYHGDWSTMRLAVSYKLGVAYICDFDFARASEAFAKAADSIAASGNWHYIPFMRTLEAITYLGSVDSSATTDLDMIKSRALEILAPTLIERDLRDTVVLPGDYWGGRKGQEYTALLQQEGWLKSHIESRGAVVDVLFALVTCLYQFDKSDLDSLKKELFNPSVVPSAKYHIVLGEYYRRIGKYNSAVAAFDDGLLVIDQLPADRDSMAGFALVFQGAALCYATETETAREVLEDLDTELVKRKKFLNWSSPSGLVKPEGSEFELILSFRRNGLKQLIDASNSSK